MRSLAVLAAGGHASVVAEAAALQGWQVTMFDDAWPEVRPVGPWPIRGTMVDFLFHPSASSAFHSVIVAIGDNECRLRKQEECLQAGLQIATIVHPASTVSALAEIGAGSVVMAGGIVNPFAILGKACIVNTGASVDHECVIGDGVHVSPGARLGGRVRVGRCSWVGIGAAVRHGITVGANVIVGAGAAVVRDVGDGMIVAGVPAKPLKC